MERKRSSLNRRVCSSRSRSTAAPSAFGHALERLQVGFGPHACLRAGVEPDEPPPFRPDEDGHGEDRARRPRPPACRCSTSGRSETSSRSDAAAHRAESIHRAKSGAYGWRWFDGSSNTGARRGRPTPRSGPSTAARLGSRRFWKTYARSAPTAAPRCASTSWSRSAQRSSPAAAAPTRTLGRPARRRIVGRGSPHTPCVSAVEAQRLKRPGRRSCSGLLRFLVHG